MFLFSNYRYGDETWTNKPDCFGTQKFCDMTKETLENAKEKIMAKVKANATGNVTSAKSKWFVPIRNSKLNKCILCFLWNITLRKKHQKKKKSMQAKHSPANACDMDHKNIL